MTRSNPLPDFPENLLEFQEMFGEDEDCLKYLEQVRWPDGFVCPRCGQKADPVRISTRPKFLRCVKCQYQASATAGTILHRAHLPLRYWFWGAYMLTTSTPGISALQFQKQLGLTRYETAYQMLRKLRAGMVRLNRDRIGGVYPIEFDVAYIGGATKGLGRGVTKKVPVMVAVEIREGSPPKNIHEKEEQRFYAGRVRLRKTADRKAGTVEKFMLENVAPGSLVFSDDDSGFQGLKGLGYVHEAMAMRKDKDKLDTWAPLVGLVISNLKTWLQGTFHGAVRRKHLQVYLNEYTYRFNRRFGRMQAFRTLLQIGSTQRSPTYEEHYAGTFPIPNPGGSNSLPPLPEIEPYAEDEPL